MRRDLVIVVPAGFVVHVQVDVVGQHTHWKGDLEGPARRFDHYRTFFCITLLVIMCHSREAGPRLQGSCNNSISLRYLCEQGIDCIFQIQATPLTISKLLNSEHM